MPAPVTQLLSSIARLSPGLSAAAKAAEVANLTEAAGVDPTAIDLEVASSALVAASYDLTTGTLTITFTDGSSHAYTVSLDVVLGFLSAPSQGAYFNSVIRPLG